MPISRRRSSHLAFQRLIATLLRLLHGPVDASEVRRHVSQTLGPDAYGQSPARMFEYDLHSLRDHWQCQIKFDRGSRTYQLIEVGFPLLDLCEDDLAALAFLHRNFSPDAPQGLAVRALVDRLAALLPEERRRRLARLQTIPDLDLAVLDQEAIAHDVWATVEQAVLERRQLAFSYRPTNRETTEPAEQSLVVEPYEVEFRDGHYYLRCYCVRMRSLQQERALKGLRRYRLSRIVPGTAQVLPGKLPPGARPSLVYTIRYRLGPAVARGGVTPRFPDTRVTMLPDGWAEVEARTVDLWQAHRVLLRYGEQCRVLEPLELVEMMRRTAAAMAQLYAGE